MAEIQDFSATDAANTTRWPEGMLGNQINNAGRADEGILARWYQDMNGSRTASGSANDFAVTSSRTISALVDNLSLVFTANHAITGASRLNLNGLGLKDIKRLNGMATVNGDIISGQPVYVIYKLAADDWFMLSAPAALGTPTLQVSESAAPSTPAAGEGVFYESTDNQPRFKNDAGTDYLLAGFEGQLIHARDSKASGTVGGAVTNGSYADREITELTVNEVTGASLASNQIVLPAGTYIIMAELLAYNGGGSSRDVKAKLRNISDAADIIVGRVASEISSGETGVATVKGKFTLAAQKTVALQMRASGVTVTAGEPATFSDAEVYTDAMIWKVR